MPSFSAKSLQIMAGRKVRFAESHRDRRGRLELLQHFFEQVFDESGVDCEFHQR